MMGQSVAGGGGWGVHCFSQDGQEREDSLRRRHLNRHQTEEEAVVSVTYDHVTNQNCVTNL